MGGDRLSGKKKYTNGEISKFFYPGTEPDGWVLGCTAEYREKASNGTKRAWKKESYRSKQGATRNSTEYSKKISQISSDSWKNSRQSHCKHISDALKSFYSTEDGKKIASERQKKIWATKAYRDKQIRLIRDSHRNLYKLHPEYLVKLSNSSKRNWQDNHDERLMMEHLSKSINNSWNSSEPEENFYSELLQKYKEDDIIRQYRDDRYPFRCDFYIKSEDRFIEIQGSWVHGDHPFDKNNPDDLERLSLMEEKAKNSAYYRNAIKTWIVIDPLKVKIASENGINISFIY